MRANPPPWAVSGTQTGCVFELAATRLIHIRSRSAASIRVGAPVGGRHGLGDGGRRGTRRRIRARQCLARTLCPNVGATHWVALGRSCRRARSCSEQTNREAGLGNCGRRGTRRRIRARQCLAPTLWTSFRADAVPSRRDHRQLPRPHSSNNRGPHPSGYAPPAVLCAWPAVD